MKRSEILGGLRADDRVSVLVVGGGINGIGTFRDLALNGVDVLLVERADFCSGASAASSHMAHGGIRYLENGEFRLVREAVRERNAMLRNAPHIVWPLPTTIPVFRRFSGLLNAPLKFLGLLDRPSERGSVVIKIGLLLYDAFTGNSRPVPRHRFLGRTESLRRWPRLNPAIVNTATYFDGAIMHPERLALELVEDAEAANPGARALNYVTFMGIRNGGVELRDEASGDAYTVRPNVLVNAAGPWIDKCNDRLGAPSRLIGGTKGSHIVLKHAALREAIGNHEFFFENEDGRIVLIFPLYDRVLVGTSDDPADDPDIVRCTDDEVAYFLALVRRVFPTLDVSEGDIVFRFSGVRPLAAHSSRTTGQISRDHELRVGAPPQTGLPFPTLSMVGGKWTSWRAFSEQATDHCLGYLRRPRTASTRSLEIGGSHGYPPDTESQARFVSDLAARFEVSIPRAKAFFGRYGTRALQVAKYASAGKDTQLVEAADYTRREIEFMALNEKVLHLDDVMLRRTTLAMLGRATRAALAEIADALAEPLQWDAPQQGEEVRRCEAILREKHGISL